MQLQTEKIKFCALVSVLVAFCALAVSTRYLAVGGNLDFGQKLFFYVYTAGQLFLGWGAKSGLVKPVR